LAAGGPAASANPLVRQAVAQTLAENFVLVGLAYSEQGRYDRAADRYAQAVGLNSSDAVLRSNYGFMLYRAGKTEEGIRQVREAVRLQPNDPEAHNTLGTVLSAEGQRDEAIAEFQRAIQLNPSYAYAHGTRGTILRDAGRLEEAIAESKRSLELDPLSLGINRGLGYAYYDARQYDRAIDQERKTLELDPNYSPAHNILGRAYLQKAMYNEGIAEFEKAGSGDLYDLGRAYAMAGRMAEAQKVLEQLSTRSKQRYVAPKGAALIYAALGEKEKAFEWLEKSYQDHSLGVGPSIKSFPGFDPLRSDPRFADLLRRMNLQP